MAKAGDVIEKQVLLKAPIQRVWEAISDAGQFGQWFGARFAEPFRAGRRVQATLVPTATDAEVAAQQAPYSGMTFDIHIERMEPMRHLSFRWQPGVPEDGVVPSPDEMTVVSFDLEKVAGGTRLTIRESGFEAIPLERRASAFEGNAQGWEIQAMLLAKYLESSES